MHTYISTLCTMRLLRFFSRALFFLEYAYAVDPHVQRRKEKQERMKWLKISHKNLNNSQTPKTFISLASFGG